MWPCIDLYGALRGVLDEGVLVLRKDKLPLNLWHVGSFPLRMT